MQARTYWRVVTADHAEFLDQFLAVLHETGARFCLIGGQAVNAYVEPVVSLDLDVVVAVDDLTALLPTLRARFTVQGFTHSLNLSVPDSDLRIQIQTDDRYTEFLDRAAPATVLGITLPVAAVEDVLRGKVWAAVDPTRRRSKKLKDLADIARLLERYPALRVEVPSALWPLLEDR